MPRHDVPFRGAERHAPPWLEAMAGPVRSMSTALASTATSTAQPKRLAFLFVPTVLCLHWTPEGIGADWKPFHCLNHSSRCVNTSVCSVAAAPQRKGMTARATTPVPRRSTGAHPHKTAGSISRWVFQSTRSRLAISAPNPLRFARTRLRRGASVHCDSATPAPIPPTFPGDRPARRMPRRRIHGAFGCLFEVGPGRRPWPHGLNAFEPDEHLTTSASMPVGWTPDWVDPTGSGSMSSIPSASSNSGSNWSNKWNRTRRNSSPSNAPRAFRAISASTWCRCPNRDPGSLAMTRVTSFMWSNEGPTVPIRSSMPEGHHQVAPQG